MIPLTDSAALFSNDLSSGNGHLSVSSKEARKTMDDLVVENMKQRLIRLRRVAAIAQDKAVVDLVTQTADEIEADLRSIDDRASIRVETDRQ